MNNKIADFKFGINNQAMGVLNMLDLEPDFADYKEGKYQVNIKTLPWYNGRESGFVLSMQQYLYDGTWIHIAVFEHRNSDNICALKWETKNNYFNHPLEDENIFEVAYSGGNKYDVSKTVGYGKCGEMANWVYEQLKNFYKNKIMSHVD